MGIELEVYDLVLCLLVSAGVLFAMFSKEHK